MLHKIRSYVRRHHIGLLALFIALSGTAYATTIAPTNSVVTRSIKNGAVKTPKIHKGAVTGPKLSGPINATTIGGVKEQPVRASAPDPTALTQVASVDGLVISFGCGAGGDSIFQVQGSAAGDQGTLFRISDVNSPALSAFTDTAANSFQLNGGSFTMAAGWASMRRSDGSIVRFDWEVRDLTNGFGTSDDCFLSGFARTAS